MAPTRSQQSVDGLNVQIQQKLDAHAATSGVRLQVVDVVCDGDDWLHFVVQPAEAGVRAYDYAKALSDVEVEPRQEGEHEVLLVPAMPD